MSKFKKKPVEIEAFKWTGNVRQTEDPEWIIEAIKKGIVEVNYSCLEIITLEGTMKASVGDYIIKGVKGEIYPCKPDIFEMTYSGVKEGFNLSWGEAIDLMKKGFHLARNGWNGKNMFVVYQKGYPDGINCNAQTALAWGMKEGELFKCEPYMQIQTVNGSHAMWVPSNNDNLSNDWGIVK